MIAVLGSFDGFHKGHQSLFSEACRLAEMKDSQWAIITFTPHPQLFFSSDKTKLLFTELEKNIIGKYLGVPCLIRIPFTRHVAELAPEDFLEYIHSRFKLTGIVVGDNFRFGRGRIGTIDFLRNYCVRTGISFSCLPTISVAGITISSTTIRGLVGCGDVEKAEEFLGYPFFMTGKVVKGNSRGHNLGYPTANLHREPYKVIPADGVYAGAVLADGQWKAAAINIGYNPTFGDIDEIRIEAHLLNFKGSLYGSMIHIIFLKKIRGELVFRSAGELEHQIEDDSEKAKQAYRDAIEEIPNFFSCFSKSSAFHEIPRKTPITGLNNT